MSEIDSIQNGNNYNLKKPSRLAKIFQKIYSIWTCRIFTSLTSHELMDEEQYFQKLLLNKFLSCYFSLFSIIMSIIYLERKTVYGNDDKMIIISLIFISIFSILLWINIVLGEILMINYNKIRKLVSYYESNAKRYLFMLFKLSIAFFHPNYISRNYYFYEQYININVSRSVNTTFTLILLLRIYYVFNFFFLLSVYMRPSSNIIYKSYHFQSNFYFAIRALFKKYGAVGILVILTIFGCYFAYAMMLFERRFQPDLGYYFNSLWYTVITMITIGYGDFVTKTDEGRVLAIFICFLSVLFLSMVTVLTTELFKMTSPEKYCLKVLDKLTFNEKKENYSSSVINNFLKVLRESKTNIKPQANLSKHLRKSIKLFKKHENSVRCELINRTDFSIKSSKIHCTLNDLSFLNQKQKTVSTLIELINSKLQDRANNIKEIKNSLINHQGEESNGLNLFKNYINTSIFENLKNGNELNKTTDKVEEISIISEKTENKEMKFNFQLLNKMINKQ